MDDILTGEATPSARFDIFTGILKAGGGDGDPMTLSGVASSTVEDLHGDRIERTALKDMESQIANGLTIFLNHSYRVPEDVAGYADAAKITKRGEDAEGNAIWDLDLNLTINDENPRAVEAWRGINKKKSKIGLSIGANIPPGGFTVDNKTGAKTIKRINLLETSIVGIPANPRSWIAKALEALPREDTIEITLSVSAEELLAAPPADDREEIEADTSPDQPDASIEDDSEPEAAGNPGPEESLQADPSEVAPLESDTDPTEVLASLSGLSEEVNVTHLQSAVEIGLALGAQVVALRKERDDALAQRAEAERERDDAIAKTQGLLAQVDAVVKAVGNMPLGRKAVVREQSVALQSLTATYGAEFMKMLE